MPSRKLTDFITYRWRYPIAYIIFGVALASMLVIAGLFIPGGLNDREIESALISNGLSLNGLFSLTPDQLIFLPYRLLQAASIALLGFTTFSIKLPSIILAFFSGIGLVILLNIWFRRNVAMVTAIIAVTTSQFLLAAQSGHAGITYVFWTVSMLLAASFMAKRGTMSTIWVLLGFVFAGLSLYMPLNIYVIIALFLTALLHPHARHVVLRVANKGTLAVGLCLFLVTISPLVYSAITSPDIIFRVLGIPQDWTNVLSNAKTLAVQYGSFANPSSGAVITPVYGLGTALLIVLGLIRMFSSKYTTKSYIISIWLVLLLPFVFLNPSFITVTFVPVVLLFGLGIEYLIRSWYRLFPHNPYARVFGLLPLSVLVVGITIANIDRYAYGYHYDKKVYQDYSFDLRILNSYINSLDNDTSVELQIGSQNAAFYAVYTQHQNKLQTITINQSPTKGVTSASTLIVDRATARDLNTIPSKILVDKTTEASDRFYVYTSVTN